ncbi:MAG: hypothetical protein ACI9W6_000574 [Motiliproteus sp.]|jgi:hypothetical protein
MCGALLPTKGQPTGWRNGYFFCGLGCRSDFSPTSITPCLHCRTALYPQNANPQWSYTSPLPPLPAGTQVCRCCRELTTASAHVGLLSTHKTPTHSDPIHRPCRHPWLSGHTVHPVHKKGAQCAPFFMVRLSLRTVTQRSDNLPCCRPDRNTLGTAWECDPDPSTVIHRPDHR